MEVIGFYESGKQEHFLAELRKSDWRAGAFLYEIINNGTFFDTVGNDSEVLLLTDGEKLISFCTFAEKDDIQPTELTPWIGFVYTFPEYRSHRFAGLLFEEAEKRAKKKNIPQIYLSTNHIGLYEKYGFEYLTQMNDTDGNPSRIYVKKIRRQTDE